MAENEKLMFQVFGVVLLAFLALLFFITYFRTQHILETTQTELNSYKRRIKQYIGSNLVDGDYKIVSFDSGNTWHKFVWGDGAAEGWILTGPADEATVRRCEAFKALGELRKPLTLGNLQEINLLKDCGFTIEKKETP